MLKNKLTNLVFRIAYIILYRLKLFYNLLFYPTVYGVYIAVWWNDKVLLVKNSYKSCYTLPCGGLKKHEDPVDGALRELSEEVNIELTPGDLISYGTLQSFVEHMIDNITFYEVYLTEKPKIQVDQREVIWSEFVTPGNALKRKLFPVVKDYLQTHVNKEPHSS